MIPEKHLAYAREAGIHARARHAPLSDCPTYAIGAQGQPWRDQWKQGWKDKNREMGCPDPDEIAAKPSPPKKALRTGRRSGR